MFTCDIDVSLDGFNRNIVDGKSLMGVITLFTGKPIDVKLHTDDEKIIADYRYHISPLFMEQ